MKQQVLAQKRSVLIFMALFFIYIIHGVSYAGLEFIEGETTTREVAENAAVGTNVGGPLRFSVNGCTRIGLRGPDARSFDVVRVYRGLQLKTTTTFDYETRNSYEVRVTASSTWSSDTITVTINVIDVNEAPMFVEAIGNGGLLNRIHRSVPENTAAGAYIGIPVSAIDPDGPDVDLIYSLSGINADMFEIDTGTGQLRTKMPLDYEVFESDPHTYFVVVEVSDGRVSTKTDVRIDIEPVSEFAPVFIEGDATTREIEEKAQVGANVGEPISATDMDMGETLEYSLSDNNDDVFEIDSRTGQMRTKTPLDYETKPIHTVKVLVSDGSQTASIIVTVQVLSDIVEVPDATLAAFIRVRLGLSRNADITKEAMLELTVLDANRGHFIGTYEIGDLTGLEHAKNLTTLLLISNSVRDLTPIAGLTKLTRIEIYANKVRSLTPLQGLTNLKQLQFGDNWIGDISPLEGLTNLTELYLNINRISDISPLRGLTNLRTLDISENMIRDFTPLEGLTNLRMLNLRFHRYLTDLSPLAGLTNLSTLDLRFNRSLRDISPIAGLVNLETLKLKGCPITDFSPLVDLTVTLDIDVPGGSAPAMDKNGISSLLDLAMLETLNREILQARLQELQAENDGSLRYRQAIALLESILVSMHPEETALLANYPNPFNPETWIPYHLAKASNVEITIYNAHGTVVRHLELGYRSVGYYTSRNRSAYWDGKNDFGECVASGIYFYQMQADTISPLRKMVILK